MRRILLVINDFNELVGLESLFRRLGFDVLSLGRDSAVPETVLGFPPDLTIATGKGRHVDGWNLASKLRYGTSRSRLVVLVASSEIAGPEMRSEIRSEIDAAKADVDAVIETPFDPRVALEIVCQLLGLKPGPILEKYEKIVSARLFEPDQLKFIKHPPPASSPLIHVTSSEAAGGGAAAGLSKANFVEEIEFRRTPTAREARYDKFLDDKAEEVLPPMASLDAMRDARKDLLESEAKASIEELQRAAKLAREKREFVRAMLEAGRGEPVSEIDRSMVSEDASKTAAVLKK